MYDLHKYMPTLGPFYYTKLIFAFILGYIFTGDLPQHVGQYIGYILIITSGVVLAISESKNVKNT